MKLLDNIKKWIDQKQDNTQASLRTFRDNSQDSVQSALRLDALARMVNGSKTTTFNTKASPSPSPSASPTPTPVPDAAAKPKRLGSTPTSSNKSDDYYYAKVKNDQAKELIKKYADKYNIDPAVAVAFAGHETGDTFDPLQPNLGGDGGTGLFQATPSVNSYAAKVLEQDPKRTNPDLWTDAGAQQLRDDLIRAQAGAFYNNPKYDEFKYLKDAYQMFNGGPGYAKKGPEKVKQVQYNGEKFMKYYNGVIK